MMFRFSVGRPDSETMRTAAKNIGVDWDHQAIRYDGKNIGYANAPEKADSDPIQNELESLVGIRPSVVWRL